MNKTALEVFTALTGHRLIVFQYFSEIGYCLSINLCPWTGKVLLYVRSFFSCCFFVDLLSQIKDVIDVDLSEVFR